MGNYVPSEVLELGPPLEAPDVELDGSGALVSEIELDPEAVLVDRGLGDLGEGGGLRGEPQTDDLVLLGHLRELEQETAKVKSYGIDYL